MRLERFFKTMAPVIALAAVGGLAACKGGEIRFNGHEGVPLSALDLTGTAPHELVLLGPDSVVITSGETFAVTVDGDSDAAEHLRFTLDDGALGILRARRDGWNGTGKATVHVTMPAPRKLVVAGSGSITASALADEAEVSIAGSGDLATSVVAARKLDVSIAGSGRYTAAGTVETLDLSIAGSGSGRMEGLKAGKASVSIAGSGDATFASDGAVDASIMGSGMVTVRGAARCTVSSVGSGKLVCERGD
ncbi:MAG: hypothetical protein RLZZ08_729 [Pseudomonadota bacterium]|jgi:hypothetical protein